MFFAAGCATSISRRIVFPSFVRLEFDYQHLLVNSKSMTTHRIPPIGSRIIFNMALGPRHVRITSATVSSYVKL
jgi:hypothetical protein